MAIKTFHSKAPTRIDLAGGTIDIWPIYLFLENPVTLNLGITLFAETELSIDSSGSDVVLESQDQGISLRFPWNELSSQKSVPPGLILHYKLLRYFVENRLSAGYQGSSLKLSTRAQSPAGAGLGGSSTLSISIIGALASWASEVRGGAPTLDPLKDGEAFIEIVRDVETTVIQVPAGMQDYYGAMYGGLQALQWGAGTHHRKTFSESLIQELEKRILLFYSGQSRNSGINNWALFKAFIDRESQVREKFEKISQATLELSHAIEARNWIAASQAIASEWEVRRTLAQGITTPEIDAAFDIARRVAPMSGKICGAGGGGCFFIFLPEDSDQNLTSLREQIKKRVCEAGGGGIRSLDFKASAKGLDVQVSRA